MGFFAKETCCLCGGKTGLLDSLRTVIRKKSERDQVDGTAELTTHKTIRQIFGAPDLPERLSCHYSAVFAVYFIDINIVMEALR